MLKYGMGVEKNAQEAAKWLLKSEGRDISEAKSGLQ